MSPTRNNPDDASAPEALAEVFDRFTFGSDRRARRSQRRAHQKQAHQKQGHQHKESQGQDPQDQEDHHEKASPESSAMAWPPEADGSNDLTRETGWNEPVREWPQDEVREIWPQDPHTSYDSTVSSGTRSLHDTAASIRPYSWTGGRTKSVHRLELETLVSTSEQCHPARLERVEHHSIAELCRHPRSVAEVGATLGLPLGVAKVLLGDMAELGLVVVHRTVTDSGSAPHLDLMERVLSGLRKL